MRRLLLVACLVLAGCSATPSQPAPEGGSAPATVDYHWMNGSMTVDGVSRTYRLFAPDRGGVPVVIALHGKGSSATELEDSTKLAEAAQARGMAVAYPDGLEQSWGDNREPTPVRPNPDADVHFADQLTTELTGKYKLDAHHVFLTGLTNGANLALRLAAQSPGTYAGVAAISGQLPVRPAPLVPAGPIPALLIYGTDDPVVPYDGLPNPPAVGDFSEPPIATMSAPQTAQAFADAAKLPPAKPELLPDTAPPDGTTVERTTWSAPGQRARVLFYSIRGGGHNWPGSCTGNNPSSTGACSQELSATDALLDFFTGLT